MRRYRAAYCLVALLGPVLALAQPAPLPDPGAAQPPGNEPGPAKTVWAVPSNMLLALEPLLRRGLVLLQRGAPAGPHGLVLVKHDTGEVLWAINVGGSVDSVNVAGEMLVVALRDRVVGVSIADGSIVWKQPLSFPMDNGGAVPPQFGQMQWFADRTLAGQGIGGGLATAGDRFFLCVLGTVYGGDAKTGTILWQRKLCFRLSFPLLPCGDAVLAATGDKGYGLLNAADGKVLWGQNVNNVTFLKVIGDDVYAGTMKQLVRHEAATGKVLWTASTTVEPTMQLTAVGDRLVVQASHQVAILARDSGQKLWDAETGNLHTALREGLLCYRAAKAGPVTCVNVADNTVRWQVAFKDTQIWSLHAGGKVLVVMNPGALYGFGLADGKLLWSRGGKPGELYDSASWANDDSAVYVHLVSETRGFDLQTGAWVLRVPGRFFFTHWMRVMHQTLFMHSGAAGGDLALMAIPLVAAP